LIGEYYGQVFKGWFIPPETTEYRFYMACDDHCKLRLGETPNVVESPKEILNVAAWTPFRDFLRSHDAKRHSEWISLKKGEPHYIEAIHLEYSWGDHVSVAVEVK